MTFKVVQAKLAQVKRHSVEVNKFVLYVLATHLSEFRLAV